MIRFLLMVCCCVISMLGHAQQTSGTDTIGSRATVSVYVKRLSGDSLSTSYCIVVRTEVKPHFHRTHSEQVVVLEGEGDMFMDGKPHYIRRGDVVFIPKMTVHSVRSTGKVPLKVISVQSPLFNGDDRVMVQE